MGQSSRQVAFINKDRFLEIFIIYSFFFAYVSLVPFYYLPYLKIGNLGLPFFKYCYLVFPLWLLLVLRKEIKYAFLAQSSNFLIMVYFAFTLLSGAFTSYYFVSLSKALYYALTGVFLYFVFFSLKLEEKRITYFLELFVFLGFLVSLYGIFTFIVKKNPILAPLFPNKNVLLAPDIFLNYGRISSVFANPHFLNSYITAIFPLSVYLWQKQNKNARFYLFLFINLIIALAITLSFSLEGIIVVGSISAIFLALPKISRNRYKAAGQIFFFVILFLVLSVLLIMGYYLYAKLNHLPYKEVVIFGRIKLSQLANPLGFSYRFQSAKLAFKNIFINHGLGLGIGKIGSGSSLTDKLTLDNFYCTSLLEYGLASSMILLTILFFIAKSAWKNRHNKLALALGISLLSFFLSMFFWEVLNHPTLRIMFWSLLGMFFGFVFSQNKILGAKI